MNTIKHEPSCASNIACAVYHGDEPCPGFKECDCGLLPLYPQPYPQPQLPTQQPKPEPIQNEWSLCPECQKPWKFHDSYKSIETGFEQKIIHPKSFLTTELCCLCNSNACSHSLPHKYCEKHK